MVAPRAAAGGLCLPFTRLLAGLFSKTPSCSQLSCLPSSGSVIVSVCRQLPGPSTVCRTPEVVLPLTMPGPLWTHLRTNGFQKHFSRAGTLLCLCAAHGACESLWGRHTFPPHALGAQSTLPLRPPAPCPQLLRLPSK